MKYYAHYGHRDFILCLGYRGDLIKEFFLSYNECVSNDFQLSNGGKSIELFNRDIDDWKISFVDTGLHSNIGQRLKAVEHLLRGEEMFLANYSDGLSDLPLDGYLAQCQASGAIATFFGRNPRTLLCLGAHCDDIEIGSGGTVLRLAEQYPDLHVYWVVLSSSPMRAAEAHKSAERFLERARHKDVVIKDFRNSFFPFIGAQIKEFFEEL